MSRANGRTRSGRVSVLVAGVLVQLGLCAPGQVWSQSRPQGPPAMTAAAGDAKAHARGKLLAARAQLAKGELEVAEAFARDVARQGIDFSYFEDTPAKVLADIEKARRDPKVLLQAARSALARKEYDRAEMLARTAEQSSGYFSFSAWSDSPARALKDIEAARKTSPMPAPAGTAARAPASAATAGFDDMAKGLLKKGRQEMAAGRLDEAKKLARQAADLKPNLGWWDDTPNKLLADVKRVEAGRNRVEDDPKPVAAKPTVTAKAPPPELPPPSLPTSALPAPSSTTVSRDPVDRTPEPMTPPASKPAPEAPRVAEAPRIVEGPPIAPPPGSTPAPSGPTPPTAAMYDDMAKGLLRKGRQELAAGRFDAARTFARNAADLKPNLAVLDDNPNKLLADVQRAEERQAAAKPAAPALSTDGVPKTKQEAQQLLAQARKALTENKAEEASSLAARAKGATSLSWGLFEDTPDRVARDAEKARARRDQQEAARLLAEGRKRYEKGDLEEASRLAYRSQTLHNTFSVWDMGDRPSRLLADIQTAKARNSRPQLPVEPPAPPATTVVKNDRLSAPPPATLTPPPGTMPTTPDRAVTGVTPPAVTTTPAATVPDVTLRARQCVAEAQRLQGQGKLVEARAKAMEGMNLRAVFSGDEVTPQLVFQQVANEARRRVEALARDAGQAANVGQAEAKLTEARGLASSFQFDTAPLDAQLVALRSPTPPVSTLPVPGPAVETVAHKPAATGGHGRQLLDNARAELKRGEVATARRQAEEALTGNHGVKDQAMDLLRTIDIEEFNQKKLLANRSFDAAESAFRRREYAQSKQLLAMIDARLLDPARQARLREINLTVEMSPGDTKPAGTAVASKAGPASEDHGGLMPVGVPLPPTGGPATPGRATASDQPGPGVLDEYKQRQTILFSMMRQKGMEVQSQAGEKFRSGQHDVALEMLGDYLGELEGTKLEPSQAALLRRPVESRLAQLRLMKAQKETMASVAAQRNAPKERIAKQRLAEDQKRKNVETLMRDFNKLYAEHKYQEANAIAMRAHDLDPDDPLITAAVTLSRRQINRAEYKEVQSERGELWRIAMDEAERQQGAEAVRGGVHFDKKRWNEVKGRQPFGPQKIGKVGSKERAIESKLLSPVNLNFENTPLKQVLDDLRDFHGINIVPDLPALQNQGTSLESPISIKLDQVSLKSALNLILHQVKLTYVLQDEVLKITTEENARGKLETVTYQVADLVIPVENHHTPSLGGTAPPPGPAIQYTPTPSTGPMTMVGGTSVGSAMGPGGTSAGGVPSSGTSVVKKNATNTQEEQLIKLITSSISPKSWSDMGGPGTIEFHPVTFGLVINQTPDIQEQIQELLQALRRLQDQSVAIEVRLITVTEDFFERIGVNFAMNILTDKRNRQFEPSLLNGNFVSDPSRFINAFNPGRFIAGLTPAGTLTPTLDIPIQTQSFYQTFPTYGNYSGGGLNVGLAFLSDIQVFLMLEALQGDTRANVMQAPKLTCANGQTASLTIFELQNMLTSVQVVGLPGGQFAFQPQITPVAQNAVFLTLQPLITDDRRFVRISLAPTLTTVSPGPIPVFPLVVPLFTSGIGGPQVESGQPVMFTQYIQQPRTTNLSVQTEVRIPDGGTVVMGGLKRMAEARTEFGPPVLSKIPYINRLFKNVGYGRETESLLMMVTARIIVLAEEQERSTGFTTGPGTGGGAP